MHSALIAKVSCNFDSAPSSFWRTHQFANCREDADNYLVVRRQLSLDAAELTRGDLSDSSILRIRTKDRIVSMFTAMA
jgi:hypothetical protein